MTSAQSAYALGLVALGMTLSGCDERAQGQSRRTPERPAVGAAAAVPTTHIRLIVGDTIMEARLNDSAPARAFAQMLPLTLDLKDFHKTEKIAMLPRKLNPQGGGRDISPKIGDLTYYAPWGNLAIFYKEFDYSDDLIPLGRIQGDIRWLSQTDNVRVRIERVEG